ncbi:MAG: hypothetical protein RSE07_04295, partial [Oscillospiraceae bacterium]
FGSFTIEGVKVVYIQESAFNSVEDLNQIIHEFIHLGWNAKSDEITQRIRFFDEAFTTYFELRVMEFLMNKSYMIDKLIDNYNIQISSGEYKVVAISEFGKYGYGDFSYTIGAIFLYNLCLFLGTNLFDEITTIFLNKYSNIPATLQDFCNTYLTNVSIVKQNELKVFLDRWLYSTDEYIKYLK